MISIQLNQIAIWQPKRIDEMTVKKASAGRKVKDGDDEIVTKKVTYRYAKNYETSGDNPLKFCLMVITYDSKAKEVEKDLDRIALVIREEDVKPILESDGKLGYTPYFIKERSK